MNIAVIIEGITEEQIAWQPWSHYKDALSERNILIQAYRGKDEAFQRPYDAMLLHVWQDWGNSERFDSSQILPLMEKYATYRAEFPETIQIILNLTDMCRRPYATPYWRLGDPILYRTPAYNRNELHPFPAKQIWAHEYVYGDRCFVSTEPPKYAAGFVGSSSGPDGYRESIAAETAKVRIGICRPYPRYLYTKKEHNEIMARCRIIVCPRGWGETSLRHWDTWLSGKPMLTDRACDSVEIIPGLRLQEGVHYLVFDDPKDIPDIVTDWTRPSRLNDLAQIAENGRRAAVSYDAFGRIATFFEQAIKR